MDYSIVIPVKRGAITLECLCNDLTAHFKDMGVNFEIILVDDYSMDNSWEIITNVCARNSLIKAVRFTKPFGQHNATVCGITYSSGISIITMDEDLQQQPVDIDILLAARINYSADVVYGVAETDKHVWWRRQIASYAMPLIHKLASFDFRASSFRLMSREIGMSIAKIKRPDIIIDFHIGWSDAKIKTIYIPGRPTLRGNTSYNLPALLRHTARLVFSYLLLPKKLRNTGFSSSPQFEVSETIPKDFSATEL